jgi:hypothetical protein
MCERADRPDQLDGEQACADGSRQATAFGMRAALPRRWGGELRRTRDLAVGSDRVCDQTPPYAGWVACGVCSQPYRPLRHSADARASSPPGENFVSVSGSRPGPEHRREAKRSEANRTEPNRTEPNRTSGGPSCSGTSTCRGMSRATWGARLQLRSTARVVHGSQIFETWPRGRAHLRWHTHCCAIAHAYCHRARRRSRLRDRC